MSNQPQVTFEQTNTKVEVTTHYSVDGAPHVQPRNPNGRVILPRVVRFTFRDGEMDHLLVTGYVVKKNGEISDKVEQIAQLYSWNKGEWPEWLHDLHKFALDEYRTAYRASTSA